MVVEMDDLEDVKQWIQHFDGQFEQWKDQQEARAKQVREDIRDIYQAIDGLKKLVYMVVGGCVALNAVLGGLAILAAWVR